jgi:pantoate--beta-alanine ligase
MQQYSNNMRAAGKSIGFVPTMGYLHEGHLSLLRASKSESDISVVSIFVNPAQFSPNEDLSKYPRDFNKDYELLKNEGCDILFYPDASEIYNENFQTIVKVEQITQMLEGEFRPTHFKGVTTIVNILFNIILPHVAYFGQKDAQQCAVISRMVNDLRMNVRVVICPIKREKDGLAMSSRNVYLDDTQRRDALVLYNSLTSAKKLIDSGERSIKIIITAMKNILSRVDSSSIDYVDIVNYNTFEKTEKLLSDESYIILIACKIGKTRLIDNEIVKIPAQ